MNTHQNFKYDYIITGGGCAGLSLAVRMAMDHFFADKRILVLEQAAKTDNDRTWCYWESREGYFDTILYRSWRKAWFHADGYSSLKDLGSYSYKMIRAIDFYTHCHTVLEGSDRITIKRESVVSIENTATGVAVQTDQGTYTAQYAFNSILFEKPKAKPGYFYLLQHFKGWIIETDLPAFEIDKPVLMDFRVDQSHGTTFVYVMPLSTTRALVEYTLFTPSLLEQADYDRGLKHYIEQFLSLTDYRIAEEEFGVIPMTDHAFAPSNGRIVHLGTAGGRTKPSSGFTFRNIQHHSDALVAQLKKTGHPFLVSSFLSKRFLWFDRVLLHMLHHNKMPGARIFSLLFKRNRIERIFRFLDNETNLLEEFKLLNTLPQWPFMKAGWVELKKKV